MKKLKVIARVVLLAIFILCGLHFISTWLYFLINPYIDEKLIGFTWLGLAINFLEISYCLWFVDYYIENAKENKNERM